MSNRNNDIKIVRRRQASSGKVSYSDPIELHNSRKSKVVLVPYFIPRSNGTDLAIKIITSVKAEPPNEWKIVSEKSLSLNEAASRRLLIGLRQHLAVAEEAEDGSYILIRVSDGTADIGELDPVIVASALAKVLSHEDIVKHLGEAELSDELVEALKGALK